MEGQVNPPLLLSKTFSLNQAAGNHTLFTATGDVLIEKLSIYCDAAAAAPLTDIVIDTTHTTPYVFMTIVEGDILLLAAQANVAMASQATGVACQLQNGQLVEVTIGGGASASGTLTAVALWRPLTGAARLT